MRIIFEANQLEKTLKDVVRIIPASAKTNTHKFVLITANKEESTVTLETSSQDVSIRRTLVDTLVQSPATILESGVCLLPTREFLEIVKRASDQVELSVKAHGTDATIQFGKAKFDLRGLDPATFAPYRNDEEESSRIEVTALALRALLGQTTYACSLSEVRPILTGVNFTLSDGLLHAAATDGLRLAKMNVKGITEGTAEGSLTIPKTPLDSMAAILPKDDDELVSLEFGNTALVATWNDAGTQFVMRALEGSYPDVSRIIPAVTKANVRVSRLGLLAACERIAIFAGDVENRKAQIEFVERKMRLSISSATAGSASDEIEYNSKDDIAPMMFNIKYWLDVLKVFESDEVSIGVNGQNQPITVHPVDGDAMALVSPIRQHGEAKQETKQTA